MIGGKGIKCATIHLKDHYAFLGEHGTDPILDIYLPFNMSEMGREHDKHPWILVCSGGGYEFLSQRKAESIAVHFFPEGYNVFILSYSVAPHRYPTQARAVTAAMELIYEHADEQI